jgi:hypothetical protein
MKIKRHLKRMARRRRVPSTNQVHTLLLRRIAALAARDPSPETADGRELLLLANVVEFYER